jgi:Acetokinase family
LHIRRYTYAGIVSNITPALAESFVVGLRIRACAKHRRETVVTTPASSEFPESIATCVVCMKFVRPTPTHGWQSKCSVTQLENRWRQLIAAVDWVDLPVFTGGIGEHDAKVRAAICGGLSWLGISLDTRNYKAA